MRPPKFRTIAALTIALSISVGGLNVPNVHAQPVDIMEENHNVNYPITVTGGTLNWSFRESFRQYVGLHQETQKDGTYRVENSNNAIGWPLKNEQKIDAAKTGKIEFKGSTHWTHHGGILDITMENPTLDLATGDLLIDGRNTGTMADDTPQNFKQTSVVQYDDIKLEMRDGLLVVSAFNGKHTEGSHTLFGFYRGEKADPFIAVLKVKDSHVEPGEPQFWRFYPGKVKNDGQPKKKLDHSQSDPADIVDPTLAKCIRFELDMQESETITISHVESIGSLNCTGANRSSKDKITTLKGMEHATGLELLNIRGHRITDLTPLANSKKLQSIDVSANRLTSLQGLENKPQLNNIRATTNKITDVSALSQHKEMEYLYLDNNQLTNLNGLAESTEVENLHLAHNKLTDVSRLKSFLWLRDLDLSGNQLEDVATFTEHRALTTVNLEKNKISEFTKVDWAKKGLLQTLCIADNPISDEAELKKSLGDKLKDCPDVEVEVPEEDPPAAAPKDDPQPKPMGNFAEKLKKFISLILPIGAVYVVLFHLFAGVIQDFVRRFMP